MHIHVHPVLHVLLLYGLQDMLVLYAAEKKMVTVLKLGVPVCGHPTIVHGEHPQRQQHSTAAVPAATATAAAVGGSLCIH